ncbi:amino acid adenylation domain-containing protein [Corallococcus sp. BB11-1]|uniref:non-ribosomal peptide synthetase n=1 Tax=Corallococcus sp. BB11-1 TaxID=2996783 RepID=UPI00226D4AA6|nr:non-ribosomal peptide synthetase [Corallococcus sp. BB11-1]MCY1033269.1 amino acid adenylation domain-containing protein [Corallococcus sp. BB11-1]
MRVPSTERGEAPSRPSSWDPDADLFAQGMNYAGVLDLLDSVRQEFGVDVDADAFLEKPTLRHLRALVGGAAPEDGGPRHSPPPQPAPLDDAALKVLLVEAGIGQPIDLDRDLFEQGLTSLRILQLLGKARSRLGVELSLDVFLTRPTMRHLARLAATSAPTPVNTPAAVDRRPEPAAASARKAPAPLGEIRDEEAKRAFVNARNNVRKGVDPATPWFRGPPRTRTASWPEYEQRKSRRAFPGGPVHREQLLAWLACLDGVESGGTTRYLYPSAGSTYAVQVYVEVRPGGVTGLDAGLYYYHPLEHGLARLSSRSLPVHAHYDYNRPVHERSGFCLHLVAERKGIEPLYGPQTDRFVLVEAGAIIQLLMERQAHHGIGACVLAGMEEAALREAAGLGAHHQVLLAMACGGLTQAPRVEARPVAGVEDIAIVGVQGRFPGARDLREYWENLLAKRISLGPVPHDRGWAGASGRAEDARGGFVDAVHDFDPGFFGITIEDASAMDPQERLLLQSVHELLERSGYRGRNREGLTQEVGVFVGVMWNDTRSVADELNARGGSVGHTPLSSVANRLSHFFDWVGPSLAVDASCSSALSALCLACDSLRQGGCQAAVVGGVNLLTHPSHVDNLRRFGLLSQGTTSDAFGDEASGWLPGEGVGALLLRPLSKALADGDHVWGVIRAGTLMSGGRVSRYGAPSMERQGELMRRTLASAGLGPEDVQYIEAAAAGSAIGDASEMHAVQKVFTPRGSPLWVGTVKPNIGHLESASGLSQVAKVLLQFEHRTLAPVVPRSGSNPLIRLEGGPVEILDEARPWEGRGGAPLRALVNSFGGTGAYASVLLESPPAVAPPPDETGPWLFVLSARSPEQLRRYVETWVAFLGSAEPGRVPPSQVATTLLLGRDAFAQRLAVVAASLDAWAARLEAFLRGTSVDGLWTGTVPEASGAPDAALSSTTLDGMARAWVQGRWDGGLPEGWGARSRKVPLPTHPFQTHRQVRDARPGEPRSSLAPRKASPDARAEGAMALIREGLTNQLGDVSFPLSSDQRFHELGLNSMGMVRAVHALEKAVGTALPADLFLRHRTVGELAAWLGPQLPEARTAPVREPRPPKAPDAAPPLSEGQQGLWTVQRLDPAMSAYNCPVCFHVKGSVDRARLERTCAALLREFPALSASIQAAEAGLVQSFDVTRRVELQEEDVSALSPDAVIAHLRLRAREPFRLEQGPLLRARLLWRSDREAYVLFTVHHIVFDGNSFRPFRDAFLRLYSLSAGGRSPEPRPPSRAFADFVEQERRLLQGAEGARRLAYWKTRLEGPLPTLALPREHRGAGAPALPRGVCHQPLPGPLSEAVARFVRESKAYPSSFFLAVFKVLLFRLTGQQDAILGLPVDLRSGAGDAQALGFFVNMVPIRTRASSGQSFDAFQREVQSRVLEGLANSHPFAALVRALGLGTTERAPVFQAVFAYQGAIGAEPPPEASHADFAVEMVEEVFQEGEYELSLEVFERARGFVLRFTYDANLYDAALMARCLEQYTRLLEAVMQAPSRPLGHHPLLSEAEREQLLRSWNGPRVTRPTATLHGLFEAQARQTPDAVAVSFEGQALSYRRLDARANRLARFLQSRGVGPDSLVGVCMERSAELVVALLGILKAGGAYVPIDPEHPEKRISFVVSDIRAPVLLVQPRFQEKFPHAGAAVVSPRELWEDPAEGEEAPVFSAVEPRHLAYVIYTSGSTGNPKGCMVSHGAVHNRLAWMQEQYGLGPADRVLQKTPYSFDVSVWEFFWPLMTGATLVMMPPGRHTDPRAVARTLEAERITVCHFVPSMLRAFVDVLEPGRCASLRCVFASGESLPRPLVERTAALLPGAELHNLYGPTEAAVDVSFWRARPRADHRVPIGQPIANIQLYVLDACLEPMPVGVAGELYIAGVGLARGYLGRAGLTAERFIPNPHDAGASPRMYKTGDLARWLPDGTLEYLGRRDHQVKVRGFRIELGEIESCLLQHAQVSDCAVLAEPDATGERQLVAYLVPREGTAPGVASLRAFVGAELPEHMVPSRFIALQALPLTPSGKVDRAALRRTEGVLGPDGASVAPRTRTERVLAEIWKELLGLREVGVTADFFELGGHSLKLAMMATRVEGALPDSRFDPVAFHRQPTIEGLARLLDAGPALERELVPRLLESEGPAELSIICCPYAGADAAVYQPLARELGRRNARIAVYAVAPPPLDTSAELDSVERLAEACVARILERVEGPLGVYGHCTGSFLALEIARRLEASGRTVKVLFVGAAFPFHKAAGLLPVSDLWRWVGDERIHGLMKAWGAPKDDIDSKTLAGMVRRFRRDARMAFAYGKRRRDWRLTAPIVNIVSADDALTKGFRQRYLRWGELTRTVRLVVLKDGEHYFVGKKADVVADIVQQVQAGAAPLVAGTRTIIEWK